MKIVGEVFNYFILKRGNDAYTEDEQPSQYRLIEIFHGQTIEKKK